MFTEGMEALIYEMFTLAVEEFKALSNAGVIVGGKLAPGAWRPDGRLVHRVSNYRSAHHVRELVEFFAKGGAMDAWIQLASLPVDPNQIRQGLTKTMPRKTKRHDG